MALDSYAYKQARRRLRSQGLPCWLCRGEIDYDLPWPNRGAFVLDHVQPIDEGGSELDPGNHAAAHVSCNARRGALQGNAKRRRPPRPMASRIW